MFKKVKFTVGERNIVSIYEYKNMPLSDVVRILNDSNVIGFSATRMTTGQYLKGKKSVNV